MCTIVDPRLITKAVYDFPSKYAITDYPSIQNYFRPLVKAEEVVKGLDLQGKVAIVTGGNSGIGEYMLKSPCYCCSILLDCDVAYHQSVCDLMDSATWILLSIICVTSQVNYIHSDWSMKSNLPWQKVSHSGVLITNLEVLLWEVNNPLFSLGALVCLFCLIRIFQAE